MKKSQTLRTTDVYPSFADLIDRKAPFELDEWLAHTTSRNKRSSQLIELDSDQHAEVVHRLGHQRTSELLESVHPHAAARFGTQLELATFVSLLRPRSAYFSADVLRELPSAQRETTLVAFPPEAREDLEELLRWDPSSAGGNMTPSFLVLPGATRTADAIVELRDSAKDAVSAGLRVGGVFTFPGHSYAPGGGAQASQDESAAIEAAVASLAREEIVADIRSGGSTPSWDSSNGSALTEARPGVYVFNDAQQLELETCTFSDIALTVVATVVSRHGQDVVVDAGSKVLGADRAAWATGYGRVLDMPDARIHALSEHHATIRLPDGVELYGLGSTLHVIPNHVCNTVNLADEVFVVRGGDVIERWAVAARGANT